MNNGIPVRHTLLFLTIGYCFCSTPKAWQAQQLPYWCQTPGPNADDWACNSDYYFEGNSKDDHLGYSIANGGAWNGNFSGSPAP